MYYYADGDNDLIRIEVDERPEVFVNAPAKRYIGAAAGGWVESLIGNDLAVVAVCSGDDYPVDEAGARRVMAAIDYERDNRSRFDGLSLEERGRRRYEELVAKRRAELDADGPDG